MDMSHSRKRAARQKFTELANKLKSRDLGRIFTVTRAKLDRLGVSVPQALDDVWADIKTMASLIESYANGSYREVPWRSLTAIGGALLYFVAPLDALPDILPLAGYLDDAFIIKLVFDLVGKDLEDYKRWRDGGLVIDHDTVQDS